MTRYYWNSYGVKTEVGWEFPQQAPHRERLFRNDYDALKARDLIDGEDISRHYYYRSLEVMPLLAERTGRMVLPDDRKVSEVLVLIKRPVDFADPKVVGMVLEMILETNI